MNANNAEESEKSTLGLKIDRSIYNIAKFEKEFSSHYKKPHASAASNIKTNLKKLSSIYHPKNILNIFTILNLASEYKFKEYLIPDIISGLTVGVLHIPTSLAYGAITSLNLVHGLYSTFFPSLVYALFATSRHLSVGTFAIISIMVYSTIMRLENKYMNDDKEFFLKTNESYSDLNQTNYSSNFMMNERVARRESVKLMIATSLSFWCGIVKVIFSNFFYLLKMTLFILCISVSLSLFLCRLVPKVIFFFW
jgi:hypothetical protein